MATTSKRRLTAIISMAIAALALAAGSAFASAGSVSSGGSTSDGGVNANCAYTTDVPDTDLDTITVDLVATANATASSPANPVVSTSVVCELRGTTASGSAGITLIGPAAAATGTGSFHRLTTPQLCVRASAALLNGETIEAPERCTDLNPAVIIDPATLLDEG